MTLGPQFKEHMSLRQQVGRAVAENRKLAQGLPLNPDLPPPSPDYFTGSQGKPGLMHEYKTLEGKNAWLRFKLDRTNESNAMLRGELAPQELHEMMPDPPNPSDYT